MILHLFYLLFSSSRTGRFWQQCGDYKVGTACWTTKGRWVTKRWFNSNPDGHKKVHSHAEGSHIWLPKQPIGEREAWRHAAAIVGNFTPSLRKR
jgi:hypothetical protein